MKLAIQIILWAAWLPLQILLIQSLLRGLYGRFPLLFAYTITSFLTTVVEISARTALIGWGSRGLLRAWHLYYWVDDALMQALIYAVVISLIYKVMERAETRAAVRRALIVAGALLFAALFFWHAGSVMKLSSWMTLVSRDLSFAAVILDMVLWLKLIASKHKDNQLLLLSGGLGVQFAGSAIGQSVRELADRALGHNSALSYAGGILVAVSNLVCVYIWWQAFRRREAASAPTQNVRTQSMP